MGDSLATAISPLPPFLHASVPSNSHMYGRDTEPATDHGGNVQWGHAILFPKSVFSTVPHPCNHPCKNIYWVSAMPPKSSILLWPLTLSRWPWLHRVGAPWTSCPVTGIVNFYRAVSLRWLSVTTPILTHTPLSLTQPRFWLHKI